MPAVAPRGHGGGDTLPAVAVVIPTRRRETRLAFALEALAAQTYPLDRLEVIVVRDGDDPQQRAQAPPGLRMRVVTMERRRSPAAKRNAGWRASSADLVAFTDDDCRPSPQWVAQLAAAWGPARGSAVLQGAVRPDPDEEHLLTGLARSLVVAGADGWYQTANLALPRELLERLGGFDGTFVRSGEDTDLGLRAEDLGARPAFAQRAVVWHAVHERGVAGALRDAWRGGDVAKLLRRHPRQRRRIFLRVFWKRSHATLLLALAGAALAPWRRASLLAAAPYVWEAYDRGVPASPRHLSVFAAHLPVQAAVDLTETIATARGSIRARTPLL